jgi:hypothetical protein
MTEEQDNIQNLRIKNLEDCQTEIKTDIRVIKENHLAHIQESVANIEKGVSKNKVDLEWLKKFFWIIATAAIGGLIAAILNLLVSI